jgi:hypothetical protein
VRVRSSDAIYRRGIDGTLEQGAHGQDALVGTLYVPAAYEALQLLDSKSELS